MANNQGIFLIVILILIRWGTLRKFQCGQLHLLARFYTNDPSVKMERFLLHDLWHYSLGFNLILINKVIEWFVTWGTTRPFPIDMAGFAINLHLLLSHPSARFSLLSPRGMQESHILKMLVRPEDLECKADNSTQIYVWHTNTRSVLLAGEKSMGQKKLFYDRNILEQF